MLPPARIWGKMNPGCMKLVPHLFQASWRSLYSHALVQLCALTPSPGQDPSHSFSQGWAGMSKGGLPNLLCQQSAFFSSESTGEGLAAACFSSSSPRLSSSPFLPPTAPSQYQPGSLFLPVVSASLLALPSGSQLSSSDQGSRQGREGRTVTRRSCWPRSAALRVAPSAQQQSGLSTDGRTAGHLPSGGQRPLPGVTFCKWRRAI